MVPPGVMFAFALTALFFGAVALLAAYWWLTRATDGEEAASDPVEDWHREAVALAQTVQKVAKASASVADHDRIQRRVIPLAERIKGHARSAPSGVEDRLVGDLHDLGVACYKIGMEHTVWEAARTGEFLEERLDELGAAAADFEAKVESRPSGER